MNKKEQANDNRGYTRVIHRAYIRDGRVFHYGEPVLLACLLKAKGKSRRSPDMTDVQKIMRDQNLKK